MRKRILSMFLVLVMAIGVLAGCGNNNPKETTAENTKPEGTTQGEVADATTQEEKGEPVTVKWLIWGDETKEKDVVLEALNEKLIEKINVKLELELIPYAEYDQRVKMASTSNEEWDIVYTSNWKNKFNENMSREAFLDITDLIEQYGQDIVANLQPELWDVATVSGRRYAIPNQQIAARRTAVFVQKTIADKYGWTKTHVDDWTELFPLWDAIRDNEKDLIPFHSTVPIHYDKTETVTTGIEIDVNDDPADGVKVLWQIYDNPYSFKSMSAEMYEKGYLHPDAATGYDFNALKAAGKFATFAGTASPYAEVSVSSSIGVEHIMVTVGEPYFSMTAGQDTMLAINVNSKNPDAAVKLINALWADEELYNTLLFGVENVHYKKVGDQRVEVVEGSEWIQYKYAWALGNSFAKWKLPGEMDDIYELTSEINRSSRYSPIRGFTPDLTNLSSEVAQVAAVNKEYDKAQYQDNWPEILDTFYEDLKAAGIETIAAEIQRQLDEWLAANK